MTDAPINPYAATRTNLDDRTVDSANTESATSVFIAWEKLRIVYNAILTIVVLALGGQRLTMPQFFWAVVQGAVIANVCYCAGPVLEGYAALIGLPRKSMRWLFFACGTFLAVLLAAACVLFVPF